MPRNSDELLALLDLETIDDNLFRGPQEPTSLPRVFGGQVAAQAAVAANRTVGEEFTMHSLHSYFLQPGDPGAPILYDVQNLRDGRSFATRRVLGRQHGRPIYTMTANFQKAERGFEHHDAMPAVPAPEDCPDARDLMSALEPDRRPGEPSEWDVADLRYIGSSADGRLEPDETHPGRARYWVRASSALPEDPQAHQAAFTYLSDMALPDAALSPHGLQLGDPGLMVASLDHAIWFHRPFAVDRWWLYDQVSPSTYGARGLVWGRVFTADGVLVATVAQEMLVRRLDPNRKAGR